MCLDLPHPDCKLGLLMHGVRLYRELIYELEAQLPDGGGADSVTCALLALDMQHMITRLRGFHVTRCKYESLFRRSEGEEMLLFAPLPAEPRAGHSFLEGWVLGGRFLEDDVPQGGSLIRG